MEFNKLRVFLLAGLFALSLHGEGKLEQVNQLYAMGLQAYQRKDYTSALSYFRKVVKLEELEDVKSAGAYFYLGVMYRHGQGVVKNLKKALGYLEDLLEQKDALDYLNRTAQKGISDAYIALCYYYGGSYYEGDKFTSAKDAQKNPEYFQKALEYAQKAADMGDSLGYAGLGMLYYAGVPIAKATIQKPTSQTDQQNLSWRPDYQKALEYSQKAAKMGDPIGYMVLAMMYEYGQGVGEDEEMAKQYQQRACDAGWTNVCD
ncbi:tetratricopeptide repeat protein [Helicobacter heilmannii]|uniref:tetratricopeptide repeat protein n=1 Tax=Helicobacter heilmannii TaxID=35817 RepID=UPI001E342684|nr:tetratricopeptide repeat protein [Helicobacter heilmannii]